MLSCLVYPESHPCSKHPTKDASPERASRAVGVFSATRPPRFPIISAPLRPVLRAFLANFCCGRSSQAAEKVVDWVTGDGVAASKRTCADTMSSKVACSVTFRRRSGYRKIIRCDGYEG